MAYETPFTEQNAFLKVTQTPATCANIALHNLYPGQIDLVVGQYYLLLRTAIQRLRLRLHLFPADLGS